MFNKKWPFSHELYLRINYGKIPYSEMRKWMRNEHSEKSISLKAVRMGISNKKNWSKIEVDMLKNGTNLKELAKITGRSINACKIKKSRLCIK